MKFIICIITVFLIAALQKIQDVTVEIRNVKSTTEELKNTINELQKVKK